MTMTVLDLLVLAEVLMRLMSRIIEIFLRVIGKKVCPF